MTTASRHVWFAIPGDLDARTGGYGYDRRIIDGLTARGWTVTHLQLGDGFPHPTAEVRAAVGETLASVPDASIVIVDGLAFGALAAEAEREAARLKLVALVHHPLAAETGLTRTQAAALEDSERRALAAARLVIVTSPATGASLAPYGVRSQDIVVVEPGTDAAPLARGSTDGATAFLTVGSLVPRKGHDTLFHALAGLRRRHWRLACVGSLDRHRQTADHLRVLAQELGLSDRIDFVGELGERALAMEYDRADAFVLATHHEGYGMAVAEALAHGLPVISTPTGAIAALVEPDAGILVPPGDVDALSHALSRFIDHADLRSSLVEGARRARVRLPTWDTASERMAAALERVGHV